jgi:hypothetical protein
VSGGGRFRRPRGFWTVQVDDGDEVGTRGRGDIEQGRQGDRDRSGRRAERELWPGIRVVTACLGVHGAL